MKFLGLEIKGEQVILQKNILEKIKINSKKIEGRKKLERFLGCLTYTLDFIKDLGKL